MPPPPESPTARPPVGRRRPVAVSPEALVRTSRLDGCRIPLVIEPATAGLDLVSWAEHQHASLDALLAEHGAVLLRGFAIDGVEMFQRAIGAACGPLLDYTERSSPRTRVSGLVFTSTDYSADRSIYLHNEQSYNLTFPLRIAFY